MHHKKFYACDFTLIRVQISFEDHVTFSNIVKFITKPNTGILLSFLIWTMEV